MSSGQSPSKHLFDRLSAGLARTHQNLVKRIEQLLVGAGLNSSALDTFEELLIEADIGPGTARQIIGKLHQQLQKGKLRDAHELKIALKTEMLGLLRTSLTPPPPTHQTLPRVLLFLGVNGSGKTTTIGKLARRLIEEGGTVILAGADTFRAAAIEQLKLWGQRVGADVVSHQAGGDPSAVVFDALQAAVARNATHLLIDTAGRLHTRQNLMEELRKIQRVVARQIPGAPHERFMVLDATSGMNALVQAREFHNAVDLTGIIVTKLDGTAKGGVIVAIADELKLPIAFVGLGESIDDLQPFSAESFIDALFAPS